MRKIFILLFILYCLFGVNSSFASIDFSISPLKYEINAEKGETINRTITITNKSSVEQYINTGKSDFQSNGTSGTPNFVGKSDLIYPQQMLSEWIHIDNNKFKLEVGETKEIDFTINIPKDAPPGGHYGAVVFDSEQSKDSNGLNIEFGTIILINVEGEITKELLINEIETDQTSDYLTFSIPIGNVGNTHIKPKGKIILFDKDGNQLKNIGEINDINNKGTIIGKKIADYIEINSNGGNILPYSKRIFQYNFKGLGYNSFDDSGNKIIKYENNLESYGEIKALVEISYKNENGENIILSKVINIDLTNDNIHGEFLIGITNQQTNNTNSLKSNLYKDLILSRNELRRTSRGIKYQKQIDEIISSLSFNKLEKLYIRLEKIDSDQDKYKKIKNILKYLKAKVGLKRYRVIEDTVEEFENDVDEILKKLDKNTNLTIDTSKIVITSPSTTGEYITDEDYITIRGTTPKDIIEKIFVNGYMLKTYNGETWIYHANIDLNNLTDGTNIYEIKYFGKNEKIIFTDYYTIIKK